MNKRGTIAAAALTLIMASALPRVGTARAGSSTARPASGTIFAGLQNGYLYRSTNGAYNWQESDNGLPSGTDITALAVAPDGGTIFAGTRGAGIYVSTDGGVNWSDDNNGDSDLEQASISGLAINPANSRYVYAVTTDDQFYSSTDGGDYWNVTGIGTDMPAMSLAISQGNSAILLIGTQGDGILRSPDGGSDWYASDLSTEVNVQALSFGPRSADVAFAATDNGIYQTIDGGNSWQPDQRGIPYSTSFQSIAVDPSNPARVIAATSYSDFYRSQDGGTSWSYQGQADGNQVNALLFDPGHPGVTLAGTNDGSAISRSDDSGGHWYRYGTGIDSGDGILALAAINRPALPTDPVPAPYGNPSGVRYFPATHHTVRGAYLSFYNANNGLKIFGLPLTESFVDVGGQNVQYFERSRLIYSHGHVTVAALGSQLTAGRYFQPVACCPGGGQVWFSQTGHTISGKFLSFWRSHNGSRLFGYPISQPLYEQNGDGTGRTYLVQYFQNARMEYHPELGGTSNVVTLGLLGKQALQQRGWI
jgi:photosystem II stability/assembly factor-like uncharacterized protein